MSTRTRYLFDVVYLGEKADGGFGRTTVYRMVERDWASAPRKGDLVSLGGGDLIVSEVATVVFQDGFVALTFLVKQDEDNVSLRMLTDLGFGPLDVPEAPAAVG